jgi:hypothetical protein
MFVSAETHSASWSRHVGGMINCKFSGEGSCPCQWAFMYYGDLKLMVWCSKESLKHTFNSRRSFVA